jgi:GntR family transcriptional regulator
MANLRLTLDLESDVPAYRQITDQLRLLIARGSLQPGDRLPSVRQLGLILGINQNTVAKAYRILADEALVSLRHGAQASVQRDRVRGHATPTPDEERKLRDVLARLVLAGVNRRNIERLFRRVIEDFYLDETTV